MLLSLFEAFWQMLVESSGYLLFGFLIAGILHVFLPKGFVEKHLQKPGLLSILKASAFGVPLPLCSCSVIPVGLSLRRSGASKGATTSFFISTPEIGVDSFFLSYALLGPVLAFYRMLVAFFTALLAGIGVEYLSKEQANSSPEVSQEPCPTCCASKAKSAQATENIKAHTENKLLLALRFSFINILDDISLLLLLGFFLASLISVLVPDNYISDLQLSSTQSMLIMLLISLPLYVCASSSTPVAAALMLKGLTPGAALVFMLAGPASNISTVLVLLKELGRKETAIYILSIALCSLLAGFLLDAFLLDKARASIQQDTASSHSHGLFSELAAMLMLALIIFSVAKRFVPRFYGADKGKLL